MMKIPILAFGPGLVGWRNAATAKLLIVTTRVVIDNSWAWGVPSHVRFKSKTTTQLHKLCILGCIFSPPKCFKPIDNWRPGSLSNTFFQWAALFFLMTTRLFRFLFGFERGGRLKRSSVLRLRSEVVRKAE